MLTYKYIEANYKGEPFLDCSTESYTKINSFF